jgi:glycosyltransferase involved in cell wall biosynthesis
VSRRVLLVHATAERYGGDVMLLALVRGLALRGWQITVALPARGELADELEAAGAVVVPQPVGAFRRVFSGRDWVRYLLVELPLAVLRLRRLARSVDVVHVNSSVILAGAVAGRLAGRPVVWHVRESYRDAHRLWWGYSRVIRLLANSAVAISREGRDELVQAGVRRTELVYDGLELPLPPPLPEPPDSGLVMIGRVNGWKGQEVLVAALALLRRTGLEVPSVIAGDSFPGAEEHLQRLQDQVREAGLVQLVHLPGFVRDTATLLAGARLYVQPSRRPEPFGLALAEAMARGVACVATDAGGPRDLIASGVNGLLVPPGDPAALADAIALLWQDESLRHRLARAAEADIPRRFSADRMVDRVAALYETVRA